DVTDGSAVTARDLQTSTGSDRLADVSATDHKLGPITSFTGDANNNGLLDLTETWTYTQTATALAGQQTNTGTVTAQDANNPTGQIGRATSRETEYSDAAAIHIRKTDQEQAND